MQSNQIIQYTRENALEFEGKPLVSIITAVFNGEKFLSQTIESILNQTYKHIEFIIIDGESTDGTTDIIRNYQDHITCWISEPDEGVYDAWNKGVNLAKGQWLAFVGGDDILNPDAVESYINFILKSGAPDLEYVSSKAELVDDQLNFQRIIGKPWKWKNFLKFNNLVHVGSFHHQRLFQKYGRYDCGYHIAGDYEFLMRPGQHLNAAFMDMVTVKMRSSGISQNKNALYETMQVKIHTGGRDKMLSFLEFCYSLLKFRLKRFVDRVIN
ncbi:MAG: glycosyltransferase family 2 protein [Thermodesulfobacteriota bacterium]|nr:glycosyltransferase family 2 protein [Thermodesulfobacteriota bacterium]